MAQSSLACPRCTIALFEATAGSHVLFGCGGCGGVWLGAAAGKALSEGAGGTILDLADRAEANRPSGRPSLDATAYCPYDGLPLTRRDVGGVEIDACDHGTWFDAGEARRVAQAYHSHRARQAAAAAAIQPAADLSSASDAATTATALEVGVTAIEIGGTALELFVGLLSVLD